jgi:hypothetical protein
MPNMRNIINTINESQRPRQKALNENILYAVKHHRRLSEGLVAGRAEKGFDALARDILRENAGIYDQMRGKSPKDLMAMVGQYLKQAPAQIGAQLGKSVSVIKAASPALLKQALPVIAAGLMVATSSGAEASDTQRIFNDLNSSLGQLGQIVRSDMKAQEAGVSDVDPYRRVEVSAPDMSHIKKWMQGYETALRDHNAKLITPKVEQIEAFISAGYDPDDIAKIMRRLVDSGKGFNDGHAFLQQTAEKAKAKQSPSTSAATTSAERSSAQPSAPSSEVDAVNQKMQDFTRSTEAREAQELNNLKARIDAEIARLRRR